MDAYLLHHCADREWVHRARGGASILIAHEDYLPLLLDEPAPCFFKWGEGFDAIDKAINFLSHNWYRDSAGIDLLANGHLSIAEVFSAGLWITVAGVCREYFALKHWASQFDQLFVSCNEPVGFLRAASKFGDRVQVYDPEHRHPSPLQSFTERTLTHALRIDWRTILIRHLQRPVSYLLRGRTVALTNWTLLSSATPRSGWLVENDKRPWKGVYFDRPDKRYVAAAESRVPVDLNVATDPDWLAEVLRRIDVIWDRPLIELLSETITERYRVQREEYVKLVASYTAMLDFYRPNELAVPSEFYDPAVMAVHLAKERGIPVSWLVDGYPVVDIHKDLGRAPASQPLFDRIYAMGCQHLLRLRKAGDGYQELVAVFPPILGQPVLPQKSEREFDAIIMTWIPNDLGATGRNGVRPMILLDALRVAEASGFKSLAIKIKHSSERAWLVPVLQKSGYLDRVTILEGPFWRHAARAHCVIGGVSSAVGESAYRNVPYYVYEPIANGYTDDQLNAATAIVEGGMARTPEELKELLKRPAGSIKSDPALLFGTNCPPANWSWERTRELYTDWAANWADQSGIKEALQSHGFPLWWASTLIAKDTGVDYHWFQELHERLCGQPAKHIRPRTGLAIAAGMLANFVGDICKWILSLLLPEASPAKGSRVWFHSLEYNLLETNGVIFDRMYDQVPLEDGKHGLVSSFIIRLSCKRADLLHPLRWKRRMQEIVHKAPREVVFLEQFLRLWDIVQIHAALATNYFRFQRFMRPLFRRRVYIGHAEVTDILFREMQNSFLDSIPWSLSTAAMFEQWFKACPGDKTLITYGETLAPMRSVYFVTRKNSFGHRWVSIQHSTVYRNKMGFYHRYREFNALSHRDLRKLSPAPDYYFIHGRQYAKILSEYYPPDRIRIIGCLKYDRLYRLYGQRGTALRLPGQERMMLLAPSVGDEGVILRMLRGLRSLPGWRVVLSKHPVVSQTWISELIRRNNIMLNIEFEPTKSTIQLVESASLVVCSYSSLAFESYFLGVPSVRVLNPDQPPMVEDEPGIATVTSQEEFLRLLAEHVADSNQGGEDARVAETLEYYFSSFDGQASARFWDNLQALKLSGGAIG